MRERQTTCQHLGCSRKTWRDDARCDRHPIAGRAVPQAPDEQIGSPLPVAQRGDGGRLTVDTDPRGFKVSPVTASRSGVAAGGGRGIDGAWLAKVERGVALMAEWDAQDAGGAA